MGIVPLEFVVRVQEGFGEDFDRGMAQWVVCDQPSSLPSLPSVGVIEQTDRLLKGSSVGGVAKPWIPGLDTRVGIEATEPVDTASIAIETSLEGIQVSDDRVVPIADIRSAVGPVADGDRTVPFIGA